MMLEVQLGHYLREESKDACRNLHMGLVIRQNDKNQNSLISGGDDETGFGILSLKYQQMTFRYRCSVGS